MNRLATRESHRTPSSVPASGVRRSSTALVGRSPSPAPFSQRGRRETKHTRPLEAQVRYGRGAPRDTAKFKGFTYSEPGIFGGD
ncbi:uncharacterized protein N7459_007964 [Penicillium hispanicum]|uniref:uncharacterized protein n=1 Tax=Penicillium hispanicum TaxID=1080232 RepID=UPI0025425A95|nr:uncharacterized protein N7459_007964 [Penicillium hispanicum]KAJ5573537.1 hypothetical protein N7459_007964 [Penicillium hispanicum]